MNEMILFWMSFCFCLFLILGSFVITQTWETGLILGGTFVFWAIVCFESGVEIVFSKKYNKKVV